MALCFGRFDKALVGLYLTPLLCMLAYLVHEYKIQRSAKLREKLAVFVRPKQVEADFRQHLRCQHKALRV